MRNLVTEYGISIKQLKELVKNLPEIDESNGEEFQVFIEHTDNNGLSSPAKKITNLNKGDILISL